jgi:hypothetical protein
MDITFITTGGTIDKVYFDAKSAFEVGESVIEHVLRRAEVTFPIRQTALMRKDSLEISDDDRAAIRAAVESTDCDRIVITHGTDTMVETAKRLTGTIPAIGRRVQYRIGGRGRPVASARRLRRHERHDIQSLGGHEESRPEPIRADRRRCAGRSRCVDHSF